MADTVTGFTASRMQEIENAAVVSAAVVGDDLIMTRFDTSTFNAGNVRGAVGPQNPDGNPAGTIIMGGWEVAPVGYLFGNQTIVGGAATYSTLAGIYPSWVSGSDLVIPDFADAVPMGSDADPGVVSGENSRALSMLHIPSHVHSGPSHVHSGPSHAHSINSHGHPGSTNGNQPNHDHTLPLGLSVPQHYIVRHEVYGYGANLFRVWSGGTNPGGSTEIQLGWLYSSNLAGDGAHTHTPTIAGSGTLGTNNNGTQNTGPSGTGNTGPAGQISPTPVDVTQRNFKVRFAVKT